MLHFKTTLCLLPIKFYKEIHNIPTSIDTLYFIDSIRTQIVPFPYFVGQMHMRLKIIYLQTNCFNRQSIFRTIEKTNLRTGKKQYPATAIFKK